MYQVPKQNGESIFLNQVTGSCCSGLPDCRCVLGNTVCLAEYTLYARFLYNTLECISSNSMTQFEKYFVKNEKDLIG